MEKTTFNVKELCKYLPWHPDPGTIRNMVYKKEIPFHKTENSQWGRLYFLKSEIDEWIEKRQKKY